MAGESLGNAIGLGAILGDKFGDRIARDQNRYFDRVQKGLAERQKATAEKAVTIKDFKPTGDLLPQYAYRVAQAQADFANQFEKLRAEHGDRAAINMAWQQRQALDQFAANQKTLSDQVIDLKKRQMAGEQVPNFDKINSFANKWGDAQPEAQAANDSFSGTSVDYSTGAVTARPYKNIDFRTAATPYIAHQAPQEVYKPSQPIGDKQMRYRQWANTDDDVRNFAQDITHNPQMRDAFINQNRDQIIKDNPSILTEKDPQKQQSMLEATAYNYAKDVLSPNWKVEEGVIPRQTEAEKNDQYVQSENVVQAPPPGQQTDLASGNVVMRHTISRIGNNKPFSFPATPQTIDLQTGKAYTNGTPLTATNATGVTKPIYDSDGKLLRYEPYIQAQVINHQEIDKYVSPANQKILYDQANIEAATNATQGLTSAAQKQKAIDNLDPQAVQAIYQQKLQDAGVPKEAKVYSMVEHPAANAPALLGKSGYDKLKQLTSQANEELRKGKRVAITKPDKAQSGTTGGYNWKKAASK